MEKLGALSILHRSIREWSFAELKSNVVRFFMQARKKSNYEVKLGLLGLFYTTNS